MYLVVRFLFFLFFLFFVFFKKTICHFGKKKLWAEKWPTKVAVYFRGVVWVLGGVSEISSSSWWFSEVVGEINHVATETEIKVGWVKVKKRKLPNFASWEVKKYWKIMFCLKKFHVLVIYVHFVFQKLGPRENLKIFQCFAGCCCRCFSFFFFLCFFVCFLRSFFFLFLFHVESRLSPV